MLLFSKKIFQEHYQSVKWFGSQIRDRWALIPVAASIRKELNKMLYSVFVGILTFINMINTTSESLKLVKSAF